MRFMQSLNTRLLAIVVLVVVSAGLGLGFWQGVVESRKLKRQYDEQLQDFGARYGDRIAKDLKRRNELLSGASLSLLDSLQSARNQPSPPEPDIALERDPDGAVRFYLGESGVFIHRDTRVTDSIRRMVQGTNDDWLNIEPILKSQFDAFYFISPHRVSRIWPAQLVVDHRPDHDVTQEIFYQYVAPEQNPKRQLRWTPIYYDYYARNWVISLLVPCYDGDRFLGVMGADLKLDFLFSSLAQLESDFDGLRAFIFNDQGNLVLSSDEPPGVPEDDPQSYTRLDRNSSLSRTLNAYIQSAANGDVDSTAVHTREQDGHKIHVNHKHIPETEWYAGFYYPQSLIDREHRATMTVAYQNMAGIMVFLVVFLFYALRWLVTDRILNLARATDRVQETGWSLRVPCQGQDEISHLGQGINRMLDKINELLRDLNQNIQKMERLAYFDQLTNLQNRVFFKEQLHLAIQTAQRESEHLALMYLDLDHFKDINDSLGHEAGDHLLRTVADRLLSCLRAEDAVARLGGDEFAVMLRHVGSAQYAYLVATKIIHCLNEPILIDGHEVFMGVSIGITLAPDDSQQADTLMKNADMAMYQAKYKGRNLLQFFTPDMNQQVADRLRLERELRQALKDGEFELYYQPQVDMHSERILGVEALLRWHHPVLGLLEPDSFIPMAEEAGLIIPLGKWVVESACQFIKSAHKAGFKDMTISINVCARELDDKNFIKDFCSRVDKVGVSPESLVVEITETGLMGGRELAWRHIEALMDYGVSLAIDDFGTGFSSLSQLKRLPVSSLKIDQSFVRDLPENEGDRAISALIVAMARSLGYRVVVEGVETQAQLAFLRRCGCDLAQGFYYSRPLPADQMLVLLFEGF